MSNAVKYAGETARLIIRSEERLPSLCKKIFSVIRKGYHKSCIFSVNAIHRQPVPQGVQTEKIVEIRNLVKDYGGRGFQTRVLKGIDLTVFSDDFIAIMGPSGSGKTTQMISGSVISARHAAPLCF